MSYRNVSPKEEMNRQFRVLDQMLSMHSVLRDRYARKAKFLTIGILGCSVILCAVTFLPDDALSPMGVSAFAKRFIIGGFSSIVFFLATIGVFVKWGDVSLRHGEAAEVLANFKQKYRVIIFAAEVGPDACANLTQEYGRIMDRLPRIPDTQFASLKAYHLSKVRLSQMIDSHVGCPVWLLKLRLMWQGMSGKDDHDNAC